MPWLLAVLFLLAWEFYAWRTGRQLLSQMMWEWSAAWPFFGVLCGAVTGGLLVHFFWIPGFCK